MTRKKLLLCGLVPVLAIALGIPLFLKYRQERETEAAYRELIHEGFNFIDGASTDPESLDEAVRRGLKARKLRPSGREVPVLLGRAYYLKKAYNESVKVLSRGLDEVEDVAVIPELHFHLGLAYLSLYRELGERKAWDDALAAFSNTAVSAGYHRSDAYFGIATLYLIKFQETSSRDYREKALLNLRRMKELEAGREGYVEGKAGSSCPLCHMPFRKKSENPEIVKLLETLGGG